MLWPCMCIQPHRHARPYCGRGRNCPEPALRNQSFSNSLPLRNRPVFENNSAGLDRLDRLDRDEWRVMGWAGACMHVSSLDVCAVYWREFAGLDAAGVCSSLQWGLFCMHGPPGSVPRAVSHCRSSNRLPPTVSWAGFRIPSKPLAPSRHGGTQAATHYSNPDHPPPTQPCHGSPPCPGSTTLGTHRGVVLAMHSYLSSDGWNTSLPIHPSRSRIASRLDRRR
jgi:hypothetical protein